MAIRRVRIYPGETPDSNLIGFSRSAGVSPANERLKDFTNDRDYTISEVARYAGNVSAAYLKMEPPLRDEDTADFVQLCGELVESSNNIALVIDNRTPGENAILVSAHPENALQ